MGLLHTAVFKDTKQNWKIKTAYNMFLEPTVIGQTDSPAHKSSYWVHSVYKFCIINLCILSWEEKVC